MKSIRIGNDIRIEWPMKAGAGTGGLADFLNLTVEVVPSTGWGDLRNRAPLMSVERRTVMMNGGTGNGQPRPGCRSQDRQGYEATRYGHTAWQETAPPPPVTLTHRIDGDKIIAVWTADQQFALGDYDIILYADKGGMGQTCADQCRFVRLVAHSSQADDTSCGGGIEAMVQLRPVTLSLSGLSAYDIAVAHGYAGTEEEWLASLGAEADVSAVLLFTGFVSGESLMTGTADAPDFVAFDTVRNTFVSGVTQDNGAAVYYPDFGGWGAFKADDYGTESDEGRVPKQQKMYIDTETDTLCYWNGTELRPCWKAITAEMIEEVTKLGGSGSDAGSTVPTLAII